MSDRIRPVLTSSPACVEMRIDEGHASVALQRVDVLLRIARKKSIAVAMCPGTGPRERSPESVTLSSVAICRRLMRADFEGFPVRVFEEPTWSVYPDPRVVLSEEVLAVERARGICTLVTERVLVRAG